MSSKTPVWRVIRILLISFPLTFLCVIVYFTLPFIGIPVIYPSFPDPTLNNIALSLIIIIIAGTITGVVYGVIYGKRE